MSIRAVVVDDEPLARRALRRFLDDHGDIVVIDECGDGRSAAATILEQKPDLLFLDVQMPEGDGFEVIDRVGLDRMPVTVFVTAYGHYAVRAFDANAIDYLLKPFARARFERALMRARQRISGRFDKADLDRLLREVAAIRSQAAPAYLDRLPVPTNERIVLLDVQRIHWIEAAGNLAMLHTADHTFQIRETLTSLERKLDPKIFLRIHRSTIVNLYRIKEIQPWFHGYHLVLLEGGKQLRLSRYQSEVSERLGIRQKQKSVG